MANAKSLPTCLLPLYLRNGHPLYLGALRRRGGDAPRAKSALGVMRDWFVLVRRKRKAALLTELTLPKEANVIPGRFLKPIQTFPVELRALHV